MYVTYIRPWPNNKKTLTFHSWQWGKNKIKESKKAGRGIKNLYIMIYIEPLNDYKILWSQLHIFLLLFLE